MKKILIIAVMALGLVFTAAAQPRAIGGRAGYGVELSYQHSIGSENMLSAELICPSFSGIGAAATYDWLMPLGDNKGKGEWNWYLGFGGGLSWIFGNHYRYTNLGVAGRIGFEYNFWFPLQLSLDWRPIIGPTIYYDGYQTNVYFNSDYLFSNVLASAICLGVRYRF